MGVQDNGENPYGETPFKLAYGSEAVIPVEVHNAEVSNPYVLHPSSPRLLD